jgi:hypothetical protein
MKKWTQILKFVGESLPVLGDFLGFIAELPDKEWENMTKAWPGPTKTSMARLRAEAKAIAFYYPED